MRSRTISRTANATLARRPRRAAAAILEQMEQRQLFALIGPDLKPVSMSLSGGDPVGKSREVTIDFTITNSAFLWGDAGAFDVSFYESDQDPGTASSINASILGTVHCDGLKNGKNFSSSITLKVRGDYADNKSAVLIYIDSAGAIDEVNESNNFYNPSAFGEGSGWSNFSIEGDLAPTPSTSTPTRAHWLPMDGAVAGEIGDEAIAYRDEDIYDFPVSAGRHYMVDLDKSSGSSLNSYVRIYDQNWNLIAANDNGRDEGEGAGTDAYVEFNSGAYFTTYHAVVSNAYNTTGDPRTMDGRVYSGNADAQGGYVISVHGISANPIVSASVIDANATEGSATDGTATFRLYRSGSPDASLSVLTQLTGQAWNNTDYTLRDAKTGQAITGNWITIPAGQQYVDITLSAIDDGVWEGDESVGLSVLQVDPYLVGSGTIPLAYIHNNPLQAPKIVAHDVIFTDNAGPRATFDFDTNVSASVGKEDLVFLSTTTNTAVDPSRYSLSWSGNRLTVSFVGALLPDGDYRLTVLGAGVQAAANNVSMASDDRVTFFSLAGDLNRDRKVDFNDLLALAKNYGKTGQTLAGGNANYSPNGVVDFDDLLVLAKNYGKSLPAVVYATDGAATSVATSSRPTSTLFASSTPIV